MHRIVIDTDMGVDDAAATAWLVTERDHEVDVAGVAAVWGNTTVDHATVNVVSLLDALGREQVPVVRGAEAPLEGSPSRVGALVHGDDGMWGRAAGRDARRAGREPLAFYRDVADEETTLLALGPLTNLAI
jgi:purine nucleosidase